MGQSKSIEDMKKTNDDFNNYLEGLKTKLEKDSSTAVTKMEEIRDNYYKKNNYEMKLFMGGKKTDFCHNEKWSLDRITNIVNKISTAMLGGKLPDGTTNPEIDSSAFKKLENMKLYLVGRTLQVISGIMQSFTSETSVKFNTETKHEPLGVGFHLFLTIAIDSYKSNSYFRDEMITQSMFIYEINFSLDEAKDFALLNELETYTSSLADFLALSTENTKLFMQKKIKLAEFQENKKIYDVFIAEYKEKIKELESAKPVTTKAAFGENPALKRLEHEKIMLKLQGYGPDAE